MRRTTGVFLVNNMNRQNLLYRRKRFSTDRRGARARFSTKKKTTIFAGGLFLCLCFFSFCGKEKSGVEKTKEFPEYATIQGDKVSLRTDPLTTAAEIEFLSAGTRVKIKKRGARKVRISGYNHYWYMVRLKSGLEGWVYGARLSLGGSSVGPRGPEEKAISRDAFRKMVIGKWWEINDDGSTGYRKLYFWPDGSYKYGYGTGYMRKGKYDLLPASLVILLDKKSGVGERVAMKRIGRENRLFAEVRGRKYYFRLGETDPGGKEDGLEKNKKKN